MGFMDTTQKIIGEPLGGSVYFHLAEQKHNDDYPFAFLATYTAPSDGIAPTPHIPLSTVLQESTTNDKRALLLKILSPIQKAAEKSSFLASSLDTGEIFQPTALTAQRAYTMLQEVPLFEEAGIVVRVPNWWQKKAAQPNVTIKVGNNAEGLVGLDSMLDFDVAVTLPDGTALTKDEIAELSNTTNSLVRIRNQWISLNDTKLSEVLEYWQGKNSDGVTFAEALRMLSGIHEASDDQKLQETIAAWSTVVEGKRLNELLTLLRNPEHTSTAALTKVLATTLHAQLRPYQLRGVQWLWNLYTLKLGGCLADDMGLGKTIQLISLLLLIKDRYSDKKHLLILPASLLGNWSAELQRFAPNIKMLMLHGSEGTFDTEKEPNLNGVDLVITTYGMAHRLEYLQKQRWDMLIIDEAQAIKNPHSKQTKAIKKLHANIKFTLTGTPIENSLLDLWSLFDFIAPGLLGSAKKFATSMKPKDEGNQQSIYASLQRLVSPYILRRLKSDKRIIDDLPDKTEMATYCTFTKQQALLYQNTVDDLTTVLERGLDGFERRGVVLSYLMRLKQICNHPNQLLGHSHYTAHASGKFLRLQELCSLIAEKKEKVLIFTQFSEIIPNLSAILTPIFGRPGLELHGKTPVKERAKLVEAFQQEEGPPFFVLSLKAGGTGLNLTHAAHVIHFDRWWNPAVEDQATDRAYRIGQKKNVLVHKFICRGTIEEKIDAIIVKKRSLAQSIIGSDHEITLSELTNEELLKIVTLDLDRALDRDTEKEG